MKNLVKIQAELKELIESREQLIALYEKMPSDKLQDKIIDLGKHIGSAESVIREVKMFGKVLS